MTPAIRVTIWTRAVDLTKERAEDLGVFDFEQVPRIGEWVQVGHTYEVERVIHRPVIGGGGVTIECRRVS